MLKWKPSIILDITCKSAQKLPLKIIGLGRALAFIFSFTVVPCLVMLVNTISDDYCIMCIFALNVSFFVCVCALAFTRITSQSPSRHGEEPLSSPGEESSSSPGVLRLFQESAGSDPGLGITCFICDFFCLCMQIQLLRIHFRNF